MPTKTIACMLCVAILGILPSSSLAAPTPSTKNAQRATYAEINNEARGFEGMPPEEKEEIHCNRLTSTRYHCIFHFLSPVCSIRGYGYSRIDHGYSYVNFRKYGVEVNLHLSQAECPSN
jgi:hypothetical protein